LPYNLAELFPVYGHVEAEVWENMHTAAGVAKPAVAKPPTERHDALGRGFDGSDLFCLALFRYRIGGDSHARARRASIVWRIDHETFGSSRHLTARPFDLLPPHRIATHLSI
jgi:hypothetical protein